MGTIKKITKFFLLVAVFVSFVSNAYALETVKVAQFGKAKFMLYLPLYIAMEEGYFAAEGLDVDLIFAGNDDQIFATVASGAADFGVGDPVFTAIAQEKGFPAKTVAMMITNLGISGYTNNPDVPVITKPEDLAGLRVGSFPKPSTTYTLMDELIRQHPGTLKDTKIIEAAFGSQLALIESGRADIAIDLEPAVSQVEQKGYRVVFNVSDYTDPQVITGLMTRQDVIDQKPEVTQGMVRGLQKALAVLHNDHDTSLKVAQSLFPDLDEVVIRNALDRMMALDVYPEFALVRDDYWQRTLKTRVDAGDLKDMQPTEKSVDNSFAERAQDAP